MHMILTYHDFCFALKGHQPRHWSWFPCSSLSLVLLVQSRESASCIALVWITSTVCVFTVYTYIYIIWYHPNAMSLVHTKLLLHWYTLFFPFIVISVHQKNAVPQMKYDDIMYPRCSATFWPPWDCRTLFVPGQWFSLDCPLRLSPNIQYPYNLISGWWLSHPSEKYEFVSWDDEISVI